MAVVKECIFAHHLLDIGALRNQLVFMPAILVKGCMAIAGGNRNDCEVGNRPTSAYVMYIHVRLFGMPGALLRHCSLPGRLSLAHLVLFKLRSLA